MRYRLTMRGIISWGTYLPFRRLDRTTIASVAGSGGGKGTRTVASYDEDTTTLGVEAARVALRDCPDAPPNSLWFATADPAYLDKTNATAIHAALRLEAAVPAYDALGSIRSALGAMRAALNSSSTSLVVTADRRGSLPGSPDESAGGDGASAVLIGDEANDAPVLAEIVAWESLTEEFLDRWRTPGDLRSRQWEERFGETRYTDLGARAIAAILGTTGLESDGIDHLVVVGPHDRANSAVAKKSGVAPDRVVDALGAVVGNTGAAAPLLVLASVLERALPGQRILLLVLADGADAVLVRTTPAISQHRASRPVSAQISAGAPVAYGKYLAWRGLLPVEPPRRPEPARPSSSAAARNTEWKFGFVGSEDEEGAVHLPPADGDWSMRPMAEVLGTIVTFTIDRLAYSQSPPVVFAVVDFDGGGRLPVELTDVDPEDVAIGGRVEMTFRKLFTADGIHNYFWKARPVRVNGVEV